MFNAAVTLGVDVTAITELVTSVQFCLSKVGPLPSQSHILADHHTNPDVTCVTLLRADNQGSRCRCNLNTAPCVHSYWVRL